MEEKNYHYLLNSNLIGLSKGETSKLIIELRDLVRMQQLHIQEYMRKLGASVDRDTHIKLSNDYLKLKGEYEIALKNIEMYRGKKLSWKERLLGKIIF